MDEFIPKLKERFWQIDAKGNLRVEGKPDEKLVEGREGVLQMIDELTRKNNNQRLRKIYPLYWSNAMSLAAKDYCDSLVKEKKIKRTGPQARDIEGINNSLNKFGGWRKYYGVNVMVSRGDSAKDIMLSMFIDDGEKGRGSRTRIWNSLFKKTGVATC